MAATDNTLRDNQHESSAATAQPGPSSLDLIAARSSTAMPSGPQTTSLFAQPRPLHPHILPLSLPAGDLQTEDSRSSSSTSSPAPNDDEESDFLLANNDSQSSLGNFNLQDMQVSGEDDPCLPVHRLPNEILIQIFAKLSLPSDHYNCMLVCKRWARNTVDLLWHRPSCTTWPKHTSICRTLGLEQPFFAYRHFIKRLNLASLADQVNDGSVFPLATCTHIERLTLTGCKGLSDNGLKALVEDSNRLLALDISGDDQITEESIFAIAEHCKLLQGLNISNCTKISNEGIIRLANNCKYIKRLKFNECSQLGDEAIMALAENCRNILEIDLDRCKLVTNQPVTQLLVKGDALRELRLPSCELIDDTAFLNLPLNSTFDHLRILDLTACVRITDRAIERIIDAAPRLRNLVFAKCRNITNDAVYAIAKLGKNLHYLHLGHCGNITDEGVKKLVTACNRIRYIDLGCCTHLTDESVVRLAALPKLKRIGLVKCSLITDASVLALANANRKHRQRKDADGNTYDVHHQSSLERVHLSYCTNLTLKSIIRLLTTCPRLTHLSLTGVQAFLREDLHQFCRDAPPEFTQHQRELFCVFSGQGVSGLRRYLTSEGAFAEYRDPNATLRGGRGEPQFAQPVLAMAPHLAPEQSFDGEEADAIDEDDGLDDGNEMVIDVQAPAGLGVNLTNMPLGHAGIPPPPPPPPPAPPTMMSSYAGNHFSFGPPPGVQLVNGSAPVGHGHTAPWDGQAGPWTMPSVIASAAPVGASTGPVASQNHSASNAGPSTFLDQVSTAYAQAGQPAHLAPRSAQNGDGHTPASSNNSTPPPA